ncbi:MAG: hypothetical protein GDA51_06195 [Ekhidna sp.]|nr:hypothetical protein [Ekhidna sp.]MBC6426049.1 hypothetical protein [Ekhidna sp.]
MKGLNPEQIAAFLADHEMLIQELKTNNLRPINYVAKFPFSNHTDLGSKKIFII